MVKLTDRQTIGTQTIGFVARGLGIMAAILLAVGSLLSIRDAGGPPSPISVASADLQRSAPTQTRYSSRTNGDTALC